MNYKINFMDDGKWHLYIETIDGFEDFGTYESFEEAYKDVSEAISV